jgi:hypothetical protein
MSYKNTVKRGIRTAFRAIGDLKTIQITENIINKDFDFSSKQVNKRIKKNQLEVILIEDKFESDKDQNTVRTIELLTITEDFESVSPFSEVTLSGSKWILLPEKTNDGYLTTFFISRSG